VTPERQGHDRTTPLYKLEWATGQHISFRGRLGSTTPADDANSEHDDAYHATT
jgi:hypothetical protein